MTLFSDFIPQSSLANRAPIFTLTWSSFESRTINRKPGARDFKQFIYISFPISPKIPSPAWNWFRLFMHFVAHTLRSTPQLLIIEPVAGRILKAKSLPSTPSAWKVSSSQIQDIPLSGPQWHIRNKNKNWFRKMQQRQLPTSVMLVDGCTERK